MDRITEEQSWDIYDRFLLEEVRELLAERDTKKLLKLADDILVDFEEYAREAD